MENLNADGNSERTFGALLSELTSWRGALSLALAVSILMLGANLTGMGRLDSCFRKAPNEW